MQRAATATECPAAIDSPPARRWHDVAASPIQTAAICAAASLLSLLFTGSVVGIDNHVFHLPIIHRLYDEAQFSDDAFIQSLRYYSSGLWMLLAGADRYVGDGHWLFHLLLYLSRLLSFAGFVACASLVGIRSVRERAIFCAILCFVETLDGTSLGGHGGLFVYSFGHSEVAIGTILFAIYFAARANISAAVACAGLTFFINAFMGVWLILPLASVVAVLVRRGDFGVRQLLPALALGGMIAAALAAPVLLNILSNPDFGKPVGFDYPAFLRGYYGGHFFVTANPLHELILLLALVIVGWLALSRLKHGATAFKAALAGMVGLYAIGMAAPLFTASPLILNLHLLRSGLMIHLLAALAATALAAKWLTSDDECDSTILGPYLTFCLCIKYLFPAAIALFALENQIRHHRAGVRDVRLRAAILAALVLVVLPWRTMQHARLDLAAAAAVHEWETIGSWARAATSPQSVFLITIPDAAAATSAAEKDRLETLEAGSASFEAAAHRRIWVDFKRGAAVMWRPSYYAQWRLRIEAIQKLNSLSDTLRFAREAHIDYILGDCEVFENEHAGAVFRTSNICVATLLSADAH